MNLLDLRAVFRRESRDTVASAYLWPDDELNEFANDAVREAARRSKLILDSTTAAVCEIAYTTNDVLSVDTRVIEIQEAIISGQSLPLDPIYLADMPAGWRSATTSTPHCYIRDWGTNKIRLYQPPSASGTVLLSVYREPLVDMVEKTDEPEIPARYHRSLVEWMLYRAYSKQDSQTNDPDKAAKSERKFVSEFGPRASARNERWASEQQHAFPPTLVA